MIFYATLLLTVALFAGAVILGLLGIINEDQFSIFAGYLALPIAIMFAISAFTLFAFLGITCFVGIFRPKSYKDKSIFQIPFAFIGWLVFSCLCLLGAIKAPPGIVNLVPLDSYSTNHLYAPIIALVQQHQPFIPELKAESMFVFFILNFFILGLGGESRRSRSFGGGGGTNVPGMGDSGGGGDGGGGE